MRSRVVFMVLGITAAGCGSVETDEVMAPREPAISPGGSVGEASFGGRVQPILIEYCSLCHNVASPTGGLDVTSYEGIEVSGVIVPGDADGSVMIQYLEGGVMPPLGYPRPSDQEISEIRAWVTGGATNN